jgi:hypothetical protein
MHVLGIGPQIEEQKRLLRRVLGSPQFAHAESLQRILRLLFERARDQESAPLKEYEIAVNAINRPASFDPKLDAIVRVSIAGIRERLRAYFENEGWNEPWWLEVPKGQYRLRFVASQNTDRDPEAERMCAAMHRFWGPYLTNCLPNVLLYTELLCFRDSQGNYFRNIYVNEPGAGREIALKHLPNGNSDDVLPSYHFVSAGEMVGTLSLVEAFQKMQSSLQVKNSRFASWSGVQNANLVVLGSARTNGFVRQLQGEEKLVIREDYIEDREIRETEPLVYQSSRFACGSLERVSDYALITRRPGPVAGTCVTLISANHGRAMEGAVQFLVRKDKLGGVLDLLAPSDESFVPNHFQLLLRVEMVDFDEEVIDIQYVTHKV